MARSHPAWATFTALIARRPAFEEPFILIGLRGVINAHIRDPFLNGKVTLHRQRPPIPSCQKSRLFRMERDWTTKPRPDQRRALPYSELPDSRSWHHRRTACPQAPRHGAQGRSRRSLPSGAASRRRHRSRRSCRAALRSAGARLPGSRKRYRVGAHPHRHQHLPGSIDGRTGGD